jgi:hypothetical protein
MKTYHLAFSAAVVASVVASCSSGNGTVTLHGTFADTEYNSGSVPMPATCDEWEADNLSGNAPSGSWQVSVKVDNVDAGTSDVQWSGKPRLASGIEAAESLYTCTGTWQVTVTTAKIGYSVSVVTLSGSVAVLPGNAGNPVRLSHDSGVSFP